MAKAVWFLIGRILPENCDQNRLSDLICFLLSHGFNALFCNPVVVINFNDKTFFFESLEKTDRKGHIKTWYMSYKVAWVGTHPAIIKKEKDLIR